jgi:serine protease Do
VTAGFGEIVERLRRCTVQVQSGRQGLGSGVLWDTTGVVVTNAHVARHGPVRIELWDGRDVPARLISQDDRRDLARLEISAAGFDSAPAGDAGKLRPGAIVIAVGNPLGFAGALTRGVVHAVGPAPGLGRRTWIQAGIRLAPGNSGGPLADAQGRVVGINTMIYRGAGLAIPVEAVARFLREGASALRLGVTVRPVAYASGIGLLVLEVEKGGAADNASLLVGDVLVAADGTRFGAPDDLGEVLEGQSATVRIDFSRGGVANLRTVIVRLHRGAIAA